MTNMTLCDATSQHIRHLFRPHPPYAVTIYTGIYIIHAIVPTAPAVHHSPHLVTAKQLESELGHVQNPRKVRSPDSDGNPRSSWAEKEIGYTSKGYHVVV